MAGAMQSNCFLVSLACRDHKILVVISFLKPRNALVQMDKKAETLMQDIVFPRRTYACLAGMRAMREDMLVS